MAYIRYKEVTKHFNFTRPIDKKNLPSYVLDYLYENEILLAGYKVGRDHGIITNKKIVLFDNSISFKPKKEITAIPYHAVSAHSIIFHPSSAEIYLLLDSGYPLLLKFVNLKSEDKVKLRLLYNAMSAVICRQEIPKKVLNKIINNDFDYDDNKEE